MRFYYSSICSYLAISLFYWLVGPIQFKSSDYLCVMIKLENISLQLDDRQLYSNLTLEVPPGGRLLLKGGSGSGKTTLLRIILGFVLPDSGKVY
ncbi:MAG: ABC transporter ATP-binding protein, partial [Bacteroidota bacterium]